MESPPGRLHVPGCFNQLAGGLGNVSWGFPGFKAVRMWLEGLLNRYRWGPHLTGRQWVQMPPVQMPSQEIPASAATGAAPMELCLSLIQCSSGYGTQQWVAWWRPQPHSYWVSTHSTAVVWMCSLADTSVCGWEVTSHIGQVFKSQMSVCAPTLLPASLSCGEVVQKMALARPLICRQFQSSPYQTTGVLIL